MSSDQPPQPPPPPPPPGDDTSESDELKKFNLNKPCRIGDISFEGARRTRTTLLAKIVSDIFPARTLLDCLQKSVAVRENLKSLNAFSSVEMQIEPIDENSDDTYRVIFVVKERGIINAAAQTSVDNHSTHVSLELGLTNLTGHGDLIKINSKFNKRFYSGECRYSIPVTPWRSLWAPIYSFIYSQYEWDAQPSGFDQQDKAIINQVEFFSLPQVQHTISFENIWRYIKSSTLSTPIEIREQCGHSIKSSLKHEVTLDSRLGGKFPYEGILAKLSNDFAINLVSGGARFTRHEARLQLNTLVWPKYDLLCQVNVLAGTLLRPHKINICDRFFAGGPLTLRGFKFQGLEPNIRQHPMGSSSFLSAGVHLYPIFPYTTPESPINEYVRPHIFVNTGTLGELGELWRIGSRSDLKREALRFRDSLRYSCGFGIVSHLGSIRLELNYCMPLVFKSGDVLSPGFQWGFGLLYT